jgi:SAM-dependent methyltransferase
MDKAQYEAMIRAEDGHWWFRGRRRVIARFLGTLGIGADSRVLEIGCGGGGNLPLLCGTGARLSAMEPNEVLREHAAARKLCEVRDGMLPDALPFGEEKFDLVCMFDVLEHVRDDAAALRAIRARLREGGQILVTVPASPSLWSRHDVENQHFRRYTRTGLVRLFEENGFVVARSTFFNTALFPAIWLVRKCDRRSTARTDLEAPSGIFSPVLYALMALEAHILSFANLPFGVSLACLAGLPRTNS